MLRTFFATCLLALAAEAQNADEDKPYYTGRIPMDEVDPTNPVIQDLNKKQGDQDPPYYTGRIPMDEVDPNNPVIQDLQKETMLEDLVNKYRDGDMDSDEEI